MTSCTIALFKTCAENLSRRRIDKNVAVIGWEGAPGAGASPIILGYNLMRLFLT